MCYVTRKLIPFSALIFLLAPASPHYYVPVQIDFWGQKKTPLDYMVDVTNRFGLKVLNQHNVFNKNNIAFSPYGLTGIVVALYEGVEGKSAYQIQQTLTLPWDRTITRVGFRDIHRTIKTYFTTEEKFLAGLALNNENVTFRGEYENILKYYGFDVETNKHPATTESSEPESTESLTGHNQTETVVSLMEPTTQKTEISSVDTKPTTEKEEAGVDNVTTDPNTITVNAESISSTKKAEEISTEAETTQNIQVEDTAHIIEENLVEPTNEAPANEIKISHKITESTTEATTDINTLNSKNEESDVITTTENDTQGKRVSIPNNEDQSTSKTSIESNDDITTLVYAKTESSANVQESTEIIYSSSDNDLSTKTLISTTAVEDITNSINDEVTTEPITKSTQTLSPIETLESAEIESGLETLQRKKRALVEFLFNQQDNFDELFVHEPNFLITPYKAFQVYSEKMFLANGLANVEIEYMTYNSMLDFTLLPHLRASALKLPLDDERYYLLIILPNYGFEINQLIERLAQESTLRDIYTLLRSTHVLAKVPIFTVNGFISLTADLQRLGISEVFEPRQADFAPMSAQRGVYVRNVEQAIGVTVKRYAAADKPPPPPTPGSFHRATGYIPRTPVTFAATYPFIYFVMDSTTNVAVMAGKLMDPLNSRIL